MKIGTFPWLIFQNFAKISDGTKNGGRIGFFLKMAEMPAGVLVLAGFERAHCTVKPTRGQLSLASLPWLFFLLGLGGSRENLNEDADFVPIG